VVSGSSDRTVRVWDAATGTPVGEPFIGHDGAAYAVAVGQLEGRTIVVSGSSDRTVRVWDAATGTPVGEPFTGHDAKVNAVAVGQLEGRTIVVSGSSDRTVRVWEAVASTPIEDLPWRSGKPEVLLSTIDLTAQVFGVAHLAPSRFSIACELGIVSIRLPMFSRDHQLATLHGHLLPT